MGNIKLQKHKSPSNRKAMLFAAIFVLVMGVFIICYAAAARIKWEHFSRNGVQTAAFVTSVAVVPGEDYDSYNIGISYEYDGKSYERKMHYSSGRIKKGDVIRIMIDPKNPEKVMKDPGNVLLLLIPGGIVTAVGVGIFLVYRRM